MKAKFYSDIEYGKKLAKYCMIAVVVLGLMTAFAAPANTLLQVIFLVLTLGAMISTIVVVYKYCRCPYCGKHIFAGVLRIKVCPACHRNLVNGKKAKKNDR